MNIHEYQAKAVIKAFGAPVSAGHAAFTPDEAVKAAEDLGGPIWVVKSQIHAGGRGKGKFKEPEAGETGGGRWDLGVWVDRSCQQVVDAKPKKQRAATQGEPRLNLRTP